MQALREEMMARYQQMEAAKPAGAGLRSVADIMPSEDDDFIDRCVSVVEWISNASRILKGI